MTPRLRARAHTTSSGARPGVFKRPSSGLDGDGLGKFHGYDEKGGGGQGGLFDR